VPAPNDREIEFALQFNATSVAWLILLKTKLLQPSSKPSQKY